MRAGWAELASKYQPLLIAAPLVLLVLVLIVFREPISRSLVPDPRMNQQLEQAQAALQRGELSRTDGRGARELFEAALATDPDQIAAREGLQQVRDAAIARANLLLQQHRLPAARRDLALAQALSAPEVDLQPLQARLHELENASGDVGKLWQRAQAPGLTDTLRLNLYEQILTIAPDHQPALEARDALLGRWLLEAETLLRAGQIGKAQARVAEVVAHNPAHLDLPSVQADLGEALARLQKQQPQWLREANAQLQQGLWQPAAENYQRVLALGPDPAASDGLQRCAEAMAALAERQAADFDFRRAEQSLALARAWSPQSPTVAAAARRIEQSRLAQKRLAGAPRGKDRTRLPVILQQAQAALARDDFITPPGESAWDKLRIATAIAPQDKRVGQLQADFRARTRQCFEQAMTDNRLVRAQTCLDARLALDPAADHDAQQRLAERWLGFAEERIAASDFTAASRALASARQLEPGNSHWKVLNARLKQAQGQPP